MRVRRKVVDATYLETSVPATHTPSFAVGDGVTLIPVGELVHVAEPPSGFTVLGAGKTAMDACSWLLDNGVDPERIRWIRPRDAWLLDRSSWQPLDLVASTVEGLAAGAAGLAEAENVDDLFRRLEASGQLLRLDPTVEPTMFACRSSARPSTSASSRSSGSCGTGRVRRIEPTGSCSTTGCHPDRATRVHVDCTAYGLPGRGASPDLRAGPHHAPVAHGRLHRRSTPPVGFVEAPGTTTPRRTGCACPLACRTSQSTGSLRTTAG